MHLTHGLKAPGFSRRTHQVRNWFQILLFQMQLVPLHLGQSHQQAGGAGVCDSRRPDGAVCGGGELEPPRGQRAARVVSSTEVRA
jgi:hypothetical protein